MRHILGTLALLCLWSASALAAPQSYAIDRTTSTVAFTFSALGAPTRARAPVSTGDFVIDFQDMSRSRIDVFVDASRLRAAVPFVARTLRGPDGLDTARHPEARFVTEEIRLNVPGDLTQGAEIRGLLTIRDVSQPVVLQAMLKRQAGSEAQDLSRLVVAVTGRIDRRTFGITAYGDMVGPMITLDIEARLVRR